MAGAAIYYMAVACSLPRERRPPRYQPRDGEQGRSGAPGGGPREAIPGGVMGGRRACELTKRSHQGAVEGGGASAPVVSVTSRATG